MEYDTKHIYNKIISKKMFSRLYLFLRKHREQVLYVFFGGLTPYNYFIKNRIIIQFL